ncbi:hypothetical protein ABZ705_28810 [Streptomyces sp. NPDC006984]
MLFETSAALPRTGLAAARTAEGFRRAPGLPGRLCRGRRPESRR